MSKDYQIGYSKPPKNNQFRKGQSGNSKGRPKGSKNVRTIAMEALNRTVMIKENGRTRPVKFIEAFVHQLAFKALNGTTRDQIALFKLICTSAPELFQEPERPHEITVRYVLPDGKTMEDYDKDYPDFDPQDSDPKASPARKQPEPGTDEDDRWLD